MALKALLIPALAKEPASIIEVPGDDDNTMLDVVAKHVFGPLFPEQNELDFSSFRRWHAQMAYDDLGLSRPERAPVNHRAMALWAIMRSMSIDEFRQPLLGNFVVLGVNDEGDTIDVPERVLRLVVNDA